jgi:hypothetical protein
MDPMAGCSWLKAALADDGKMAPTTGRGATRERIHAALAARAPQAILETSPFRAPSARRALGALGALGDFRGAVT